MNSWKESYQLGDPIIDLEHKSLVNLIGSLSNVDNAEMTDRIITSLEDYSLVHFKHEENLMMDIGYSDIEEHQRLHHDFIEKIKELKEDCFLPNKSVFTDMTNFLHEWLTQHILVEDKKYMLLIK
jgi:hemerythrin